MIVAVIDYGSGNLKSAANAIEKVVSEIGKGKVVITRDPKEVLNATHIVLPGQGSFVDCMLGLKAIGGMIDTLENQVINKSLPFLGICVGMQLTADVGEENQEVDGLGWVPGKVVKINPQNPSLKIPHMGWNSVKLTSSKHPIKSTLRKETEMYFVHSYHFEVKNSDHLLGTTDYEETLAAIVGKDNIIGTQFHPEKSQLAGLKFIEWFLRWRP